MYVNAQINNIPLIALVDTGASGFAFISKSLCDSLKLSLRALQTPINLIGFDGDRSSQFTHRVTFPLNLGRHSDVSSAYVISPCKHGLVLGLPRLEKHAPYVDWKENSLTFGENCLEKAYCQFETTIPYINSTAPPPSYHKIPIRSPSNKFRSLTPLLSHQLK